MNVLDRFSAAGVRLRLEGGQVIARPSAPLTDELRAAMADSKTRIKAELEAIELRRQRLLAMLAERPGQDYAVIYDTDASHEYDVLMVAIPGATFEVGVPKPADSLVFSGRLLQALERRERKTA